MRGEEKIKRCNDLEQHQTWSTLTYESTQNGHQTSGKYTASSPAINLQRTGGGAQTPPRVSRDQRTESESEQSRKEWRGQFTNRKAEIKSEQRRAEERREEQSGESVVVIYQVENLFFGAFRHSGDEYLLYAGEKEMEW
jgi:hypothetical protein